MRYDIHSHTTQEAELEVRPEAAWVVDGQMFSRLEKAFPWCKRPGIRSWDQNFVALLHVFIGLDAMSSLLVGSSFAFADRVVGGAVFDRRARIVVISILVIIDDDLAGGVSWEVEPWVVLPQCRTEGNVVEFDAGVVLDEAAVEVWYEEDLRVVRQSR